MIDFHPDTREMNFEESPEVESNSPEKIDQVNQNIRKVDSEMMRGYGGVAIKGFQKKTKLSDVIDTLKEAGLPFDYAVEDLEVADKGDYNTISVHDLKPETCVEIQNNLHGENKFGKRISVFPLVGDSATKQIGKELETLITEENAKDKQSSHEDESKEDSIQSSCDKSAATSNNGPIYNIVSALWGSATGTVSNDLEISDDTEEELVSTKYDDQNLKRKFLVSPDSKFELLSKKERKKNEKSLNKSN